MCKREIKHRNEERRAAEVAVFLLILVNMCKPVNVYVCVCELALQLNISSSINYYIFMEFWESKIKV